MHFLRFEFSDDVIVVLRKGATLFFGIDDLRMPLHEAVDATLSAAMLQDFA